MKPFPWLFVVALATSACDDPVRDARAEALGGDPGPYEEGPLHRAGFPCTYCHTKGGRAKPHFDLAGTVYARSTDAEALGGVRVKVFDRQGRTQSVESNEAGNFFFDEGALTLEFPLWVKLEYGDEERNMDSPIFREKSCSACHMDPASPSRTGHIYFWEEK